MKRTALITLLILTAATRLTAQNVTIGGRYSNYSTDLSLASIGFDSGRQASVGFLGSYRNGPLGLHAQFDHDLENGIGLGDFFGFEFAEYSRDRFEFAISYTVVPNLDVEGGFRSEEIRVGGVSIFGEPLFSDIDLQHQALMAGVNIHSETIRPAGWYLSARGYIGTAEFDSFGTGISDDTSGYKIEAGVPIALGLSGWEVTPGVEYERIESNDFGLEFDTNRFFVNFAYTFGR